MSCHGPECPNHGPVLEIEDIGCPYCAAVRYAYFCGLQDIETSFELASVRGKRAMTQQFLTQIATDYDHAKQNQLSSPRYISQKYNVAIPTADKWIRIARDKGLIPPVNRK